MIVIYTNLQYSIVCLCGKGFESKFYYMSEYIIWNTLQDLILPTKQPEPCSVYLCLIKPGRILDMLNGCADHGKYIRQQIWYGIIFWGGYTNFAMSSLINNGQNNLSLVGLFVKVDLILRALVTAQLMAKFTLHEHLKSTTKLPEPCSVYPCLIKPGQT